MHRHAVRADIAGSGCVVGRRGANSQTGRSAAPCRSTRPRRPVDAGRRIPSGLQTAALLRLGKKRAGQLEDLIGFAQFFDLALQRLHLFTFGCRDAIAHAGIDLVALDPFVEGLGHAADLGSMDSMAAHSEGYSPRCSRTMRTARSRTSGENWFDFLLMAQASQRKEPPQTRGGSVPGPKRREPMPSGWFIRNVSTDRRADQTSFKELQKARRSRHRNDRSRSRNRRSRCRKDRSRSSEIQKSQCGPYKVKKQTINRKWFRLALANGQ